MQTNKPELEVHTLFVAASKCFGNKIL